MLMEVSSEGIDADPAVTPLPWAVFVTGHSLGGALGTCLLVHHLAVAVLCSLISLVVVWT